jgi:hypothetical protein
VLTGPAFVRNKRTHQRPTFMVDGSQVPLARPLPSAGSESAVDPAGHGCGRGAAGRPSAPWPPGTGLQSSVDVGCSATRGIDPVYYEKELTRPQAVQVKQQEYIRARGLRVVVVFQGRDAAGRAGAIQRITEMLYPRFTRIVPLPTPSDVEKGQSYPSGTSPISRPRAGWSCSTGPGTTAPTRTGHAAVRGDPDSRLQEVHHLTEERRHRSPARPRGHDRVVRAGPALPASADEAHCPT